jgi:FtsP/CotA-like multicopper oxidase with cupredoxin domain
MLSRRDFVLGASEVALSVALPLCARAAADPMNTLKIPKLIESTAGIDKVYELRAAAGNSSFLPDLLTPTFGINGVYLGPTIRAGAGDRVTLRVKNNLTEPTTLHWHGLHIPARQDGGPHQVVDPGEVWEPSFEINQKASLCWYHAHLNEQTGEQVMRGLAGLFLIEDDESRSLQLPSDYGVDDIPLIVQDRRFNGDGSFQYLSNVGDIELGYRGDVILVNGTFAPHFELRRQRTRLRILNGSNARIYTLGRADRADLVVIAADGSLLARPVRTRRVRVGPGERIELLLEMEPDRTVTLMSYPADSGRMGMMGQDIGVDNETFPIIEFRSGRLEPAAVSFPDRLIGVPQWNPAQAERSRRFTLDMSTMSMGPMIGPMMDGSMGINGRSMDMERIDEQVPLGSIEIWEIANRTPLTHPFHIHGIQFRVLDRDGGPPLPYEQGLKDTVLVDPGSTVRVITEFSDFADPDHPYMYHCHILEHEDAGMMGQFVVV